MIEEVEAIGRVVEPVSSEVCCSSGLGLDGLVLGGAERYSSRNVDGFRALIRVSWNAMRLLSELSSFWKLSFRDSRRSFISKKELPFELFGSHLRDFCLWNTRCFGCILYRSTGSKLSAFWDFFYCYCLRNPWIWNVGSHEGAPGKNFDYSHFSLTDKGFAVLWVVRLTFSTKTTPFLLVISKAHVFLATVLGGCLGKWSRVLLWIVQPLTSWGHLPALKLLKSLALLSFSTLLKALQNSGSDPAHLRGDWIHNCQQS